MPRVNLAPLDESQRARAAGSYPFAWAIVRELRARGRFLGLEFDHAVSAALYGLVLAARCYDPGRGPWPTHAARWMKGEVKDEAARWARRGFTSRDGGHGGPAGPPPADVGGAARDDSLATAAGRECDPAAEAEIRELWGIRF